MSAYLGHLQMSEQHFKRWMDISKLKESIKNNTVTTMVRDATGRREESTHPKKVE